jgi:hypothetical protein
MHPSISTRPEVVDDPPELSDECPVDVSFRWLDLQEDINER